MTRTSSRGSSPAGLSARGGQGHTPEWQEPHTGVPAAELRAFVTEIAADAPQVIFHPGWMSARHKQSFYVSRSALILNALMGNIEVPGGCVLGKPPEHYGRKRLEPTHRPGAGGRRAPGGRRGGRAAAWDPAIGMVHQAFAAMETGEPYGIGAYFAYRHDPFTGLPDPEATQRAVEQLNLLVSIDVRYWRWVVRRRNPARVDLPGAGEHPGPDERPGAGLRDARPGDRTAFRQPPGVVDLPRDPAADGHGGQGGARLRDDRGAVELPARWHRRHGCRNARGRSRPLGGGSETDLP